MRIEAEAAEKGASGGIVGATDGLQHGHERCAASSLKENNLGRARMLLNRQKPPAGELDLRDWEWRYLWSQCARGRSLTSSPSAPFGPPARRHLAPMWRDAMARELYGVTTVTDLISHSGKWERTNAWLPVFANHGGRMAFVAKESSDDQ